MGFMPSRIVHLSKNKRCHQYSRGTGVFSSFGLILTELQQNIHRFIFLNTQMKINTYKSGIETVLQMPACAYLWKDSSGQKKTELGTLTHVLCKPVFLQVCRSFWNGGRRGWQAKAEDHWADLCSKHWCL